MVYIYDIIHHVTEFSISSFLHFLLHDADMQYIVGMVLGC